VLPVVTPNLCTERLGLIFPRTAFDTVLSNPLAGAAVAAMIYLNAITDDATAPSLWRYVRPSMVTWMNDAVLTRDSTDDRESWFAAAKGGSAKLRVTTLMETWGMPFAPAYADNSRETLRDETFREWRDLGAIRSLAGLPTSSSRPRWILDRSFAELFHPDLSGSDLAQAIDGWTAEHMTTEGRVRAFAARRSAEQQHAVEVFLPGGGSRLLEAGRSSLILRGVVEEWAPQKLTSPLVLTISEPGAKLLVADQRQLSALGIQIDVANLLPDALLVDTDSTTFAFWIVEAVATDGAITESRKRELLHWAEQQGIPATSCQFLTAFESRNAAPAKRRLKDLAEDSYAWFLDEPDRELHWRDIPSTPQVHLAAVSPLPRTR
jgi:hypothetical protein